MQDPCGFDTGELDIESLERLGESIVVDSKEMQHRGMQIVDADDVINAVVAQFVRRTINGAALDSTTRHPDAERIDVVIASGALRHGSPAELATPHDERIFQQSEAFEVFHERGAGQIAIAGRLREVGFEVAVVIPAPMIKLHKSHTALQQSSRRQAVRCE